MSHFCNVMHQIFNIFEIAYLENFYQHIAMIFFLSFQEFGFLTGNSLFFHILNRSTNSEYRLTVTFLVLFPLLKNRSRLRSTQEKMLQRPLTQTPPRPIRPEEAMYEMQLHHPNTSNHVNWFGCKILQKLSSLQNCLPCLYWIFFVPKFDPVFC